MKLTYFIFLIGLAVLYIAYKRSGLIPRKYAMDLLKKGAMVIDVRTPGNSTRAT